MRNQTYAYKLVQQIFAQVVILKFYDRIDSTLPVQDIMSPSFDILLWELWLIRLCDFSLWSCKRGESPQWGVHTQTQHQNSFCYWSKQVKITDFQRSRLNLPSNYIAECLTLMRTRFWSWKFRMTKRSDFVESDRRARSERSQKRFWILECWLKEPWPSCQTQLFRSLSQLQNKHCRKIPWKVYRGMTPKFRGMTPKFRAMSRAQRQFRPGSHSHSTFSCLLYTSDAADE